MRACNINLYVCNIHNLQMIIDELLTSEVDMYGVLVNNNTL